MPKASWRSARLKDVARLVKGVSYQGRWLDQPGPKLLGLGTVVPGGGLKLDEARSYAGPVKDRQRLRPGEMFVALTDITQDGRVLGSPARLPDDVADDCVVTHHVARVEIPAASLVSGNFLYYALRADGFRSYVKGVATGTTVRSVSVADAQDFRLLLPPIEEQRAIASVLGALDDKIELNRRMSATLEALARAIFTSWFVDFDPVRAKAEGRQPIGMDAETAALFPDSFTDSPLGPIPSGWRVAELREIAASERRKEDPRTLDPPLPYIGLDDMPRRSIALARWGSSTEATSAKSAFRRGDVLFGKLRPYFHKVGIAPLDGICSTDVLVLRAREVEVAMPLVFIASSDEFVQLADATSAGTKMPRANWHDLGRYQLALPAAGVLHAFDAVARPMVERLVSGIHEARALSALRDALLPKLVSGEVRVAPTAAG